MSFEQRADIDARRNIIEIASAAQDLSILIAAVRAAKLVDVLASPGPFTVFAPSDAAFAKLPEGEIESLFRPENKQRLTSLMAHHILAGQLTTADLRDRARAADGHLSLRTVEGDTIEITDRDDRLCIVDERGCQATATVSDLLLSNGVVHVMDSVLAPQAW
ncbi:MAG: fasciclin domain-containing protein [Pseudomonadota bacterium]|nr:fasciclin domain-containing protein [Pseudomonadota bacterium]